MSIAEKLTIIAENQQKVFDAGGLAQHPKKTVSGEGVIYIDDIAPVEHNIGVKVSSKNLLDVDKFVNSEFVDNKDGSFTFTKTDNSSKRYTNYFTFNEPIPSGTQLCFSVDKYESENVKEVGIQLQYTDNTYISSYAVKPSVMYASFKATKAIKGIRLYLSQTESVALLGAPVILGGIQLTIGSGVKPYTPYIDVSTVKVKALGKNLFKPSNYTAGTLNADTGEISSNTNAKTYCLTTDYIYLQSGDYVVSNITGANLRYIAFYNKDKEFNSATWTARVKTFNFTITEDCYVRIDIETNKVGDVQPPIDNFDTFCDEYQFMLKIGSMNSVYEPYIEPTNYMPNIDGTIEDVKNIYPNMVLISNQNGVLIDVDYHQSSFQAGFKNHTVIHMDNCDKNNGYPNAFSGYGWCDNNYYPTRPIKHIGSYNNLFSYSYITDTKVDIDVTLSSKNRSALFNSAAKLKTVRKIIVNENTGYSSWFTGCTKLENIKFEGTIGKSIDFQYSTLLTKSSIKNIVNCLSNSVGATLTLSKTAVNNAFETSKGAADGSTSEEWIALITPKSNNHSGLWTISLM